jgi:hypothetical protein
MLFLFVIPFYFIFKVLRRRHARILEPQTSFSAIQSLRSVLSDNIIEFAKCKLIDFCLKKFKSPDVLLQIGQIITFFLNEIQRIHLLINQILDKPKLSFEFRFYAFRALKILSIRRDSQSTNVSKTLVSLKESNFKIICSMQRFILDSFSFRQKFSIDTFIDISFKVDDLKSKFDDALRFSPNSIDVHREFAYFLVECQGEYKKAIEEYQISVLLETGKYSQTDFVFRSFLTLFATYILANVIGANGEFITKNRRKRKRTSLPTLDQSPDFDTRLFIEYADLRLALQEAVEMRNSDLFFIVDLHNILRFLFGVGLIILIIDLHNI